MKRILIPFVALVVLCFITASCNNYTCPAYADDANQQEQADELNS